MKAVAVCLGDITYISRFHRNIWVLKRLNFDTIAISLKPIDNMNLTTSTNNMLIDGITRRLRHKIFSPLRYLEITIRFLLAIIKQHPNLLFASNLPALVLGCISKLFIKNLILIYDAMELEAGREYHAASIVPFDKKNRGSKAIEKYVIHQANLVLAADYARTDKMIEWYRLKNIITCRNVPFLYKNIKNNRLIHHALNLTDNVFVLLYQGQIIENRGLENSISSLVFLPENIVFVLIGFGDVEYRNSLLSHAIGLGVDSRVFILPAVPYDELLEWTASADLVQVLTQNTSLSYYLAAPNKLYEAAMVGIPVVASNFPEIERVIEKYQFGLTINPENPREIAAAIDTLFKDKTKYYFYRNNALLASAEDLNWEKESSKLISKIKELLDSKVI
ncbi:MAG: glycosyltransferase [Candidatus Desantisbacteria bacterium]